ncbi:hypothetical protein H0N99_02105 [Candidatus Micrarchaeota archaeon]|nr:hypothetical protein [Candidatus Micrarchaeota archaeon]
MRPEHAFIAFVLVLMLSGCAQQNQQVTQEEAVNFVVQHMQTDYPGAQTNVTEVKLQDGSWRITSEVIYGANTPCPNMSIVVYEYPAFGFVPRAENNITNNCQLLSCKGIENCKIAMPEEAIIASHKLNNVPEINSFINEFGYNNIRVDATSYESYFESRTNATYPFIWVVRWTSPEANYSIRLILNQTGGKVLDKFVE